MKSIFNLNSSYPFDRVAIVELHSPVTVFLQNGLWDFYLFNTVPEFLARFRRVQYDGNLYPREFTVSEVISAENNIVIRSNGKIGFINKSKGTRSYFSIHGYEYEYLDEDSFPFEEYGKFSSKIVISQSGFNNLLDSYLSSRCNLDHKDNNSTNEIVSA